MIDKEYFVFAACLATQENTEVDAAACRIGIPWFEACVFALQNAFRQNRYALSNYDPFGY